MKIVDWNRLGEAEREIMLARPKQRRDPALRDKVRAIVESVRTLGWDRLATLSLDIDGAEPSLEPVAPAAAQARRALSPAQVDAVELAARNIKLFHDRSRPADVCVETLPGLTVSKIWRPLDRVGLYVPGGATPLFSSLLMLAIPARSAGVEEIVVVTPPRPGGGLDPAIALAAELCDIDMIWTVGGAQAIAALAFGAGSIPRVDKICGPGNAWVAEAKTLVAGMAGGPAIDLPAGPSELLVIADGGADPLMVAADLLSQAEHDEDAQVLFVTDSGSLGEQVLDELRDQSERLPRQAQVQGALANARFLLVSDLGQAAAISNEYAPEHLSLAVRDPEGLLSSVRNAGAVFAGGEAAETLGDYLAGSSHVLPTDGAARAWSGINVLSFMKSISVQKVSPEAARTIAAPAALLARLEGLEAHARAAEARAQQVPA